MRLAATLKWNTKVELIIEFLQEVQVRYRSFFFPYLPFNSFSWPSAGGSPCSAFVAYFLCFGFPQSLLETILIATDLCIYKVELN